MTQKIVNVSELEKLERYDHSQAFEWSGMVEKIDGEFIRVDDLRALLDKSPSVSGEAVLKVNVWLDVNPCFNVEWLSYPIDWEAGIYNLYTTPQPDRVAELEAKLKVASEAIDFAVNNIKVGKSSYFELMTKMEEALAKIKD